MSLTLKMVTICGLFSPMLSFAADASIQLSDITKSARFEVYCSDPSFVRLIEENNIVLDSEVSRLKESFRKEPHKAIELASLDVFGINSNRGQIADALFVNHSYSYTLLGDGVVIRSEVLLKRKNGTYSSALTNLQHDNDVKAILNPSKMSAEVVLIRACGVSELGK